MASESEQEKRENLADIVADMRKAGALMPAAYMRDLHRYADRIEAAWRREREAVTERNWFGNAAAMREALETIHDKVNGLDEECGVDPVEIRDIARAALSAPARNCDKMPDIDNLTMHDLAKSPCKSTLEYASREELLALVRWLLAPAAERKGEGS